MMKSRTARSEVVSQHHHINPPQTQGGGGRRQVSRHLSKYPSLLTLVLLGIVVVALVFTIFRIKLAAELLAGNPSGLLATTTSQSSLRLTVVAPTFYTSLDEKRYLLALDASRAAARNGIRLLLVDGSPLKEASAALVNAGTRIIGKDRKKKEFTRVVPQISQGKKGVALREAMEAACHEMEAEGVPHEKSVVAFQELEKVDMFRHWNFVLEDMDRTQSDIGVPRRLDDSFKASYPLEQYYAEVFGNLYLDSLGSKIGLPSLDWTMGPMALRCSHVKYWLNFNGEIWDAQIVPMIHAHLAGARVRDIPIDYRHSPLMKQEEQGQPVWSEKRLMQLNFLYDYVAKELKKRAVTMSSESKK
jgi:hypothetical protein